MTASCRRSTSATSRCARGRSSAHSTCWRCAAHERRQCGRDRGELCIVLHSHMPYVEGFGTWPFGEEWLLEAIASSYLPLLGLLERHAADGGRRLATVGDHAGAGRPARRCPRSASAFGRSCEVRARVPPARTARGWTRRARAGRGAAPLRRRLRMAAEDFERRGGDLWERCGRSVTQARSSSGPQRHARGAARCWPPTTACGCRSTVGIAPRARFGSWGGGFWLPECAYRPGVEEHLARRRRAGFLRRPDASCGDPLDHLEPIAAGGRGRRPARLEHHFAGVGRPRLSLGRGIPGLPRADGQRGAGVGKRGPALRPRRRPRPGARACRALRGAGHASRGDAYRIARGRPALVVCALDTELLGHWWYEGPVWLDAVIAEAGAAGSRSRRSRKRLPATSRAGGDVLESTWGTGKDLHTWDAPPVADVVWAAAQAELQLLAALGSRPPPTAVRRLPGGPHASCWPCSPATGPSWRSRGLAAEYRTRAGSQPLARVS